MVVVGVGGVFGADEMNYLGPMAPPLWFEKSAREQNYFHVGGAKGPGWF